ncbi:peptidase inhibitor family I36 protein [Streptomyces sp. NPDC093085]|uniref:peptidase inhibitor family I36 protein n=1 Tax=Streptomyces sp. NPDC093085 TaxID=3155068 RepID=UPI003438E755
MTNKIATLAGGIVLTGGLLGAGAAPAGAAPAAPQAAADCPAGYFCVWAGQNYTGQRQQVAGTNADLTQYAVFQNFKSWYNHGTSCNFQWFSGKNHTGSSGIIVKGTKVSDTVSHYIKSNKWAC